MNYYFRYVITVTTDRLFLFLYPRLYARRERAYGAQEEERKKCMFAFFFVFLSSSSSSNGHCKRTTGLQQLVLQLFHKQDYGEAATSFSVHNYLFILWLLRKTTRSPPTRARYLSIISAHTHIYICIHYNI